MKVSITSSQSLFTFSVQLPQCNQHHEHQQMVFSTDSDTPSWLISAPDIDEWRFSIKIEEVTYVSPVPVDQEISLFDRSWKPLIQISSLLVDSLPSEIFEDESVLLINAAARLFAARFWTLLWRSSSILLRSKLSPSKETLLSSSLNSFSSSSSSSYSSSSARRCWEGKETSNLLYKLKKKISKAN